MKIKTDFITNSSSTNFCISNRTNKKKTLVDFVVENPQLIETYVKKYYCSEKEVYTQKSMIISAQANNITWKPHEEKHISFGDEDGTIIGRVFDYILRDGGKSKSFSWYMEGYNR